MRLGLPEVVACGEEAGAAAASEGDVVELSVPLLPAGTCSPCVASITLIAGLVISKILRWPQALLQVHMAVYAVNQVECV